MKPLMLEMTAFGSYADTVRVPIAELRHGLYLVAGDTGAGKTTIFDAITFALYGEASGKDRKTARMHSDRVSRSVDTEVTLAFLQNNQEYTVKRTLRFPRKRGTEEYGDAKQDADLMEPDATVKGQENVTARVTELLGMDVAQFRKSSCWLRGNSANF